MTPEEVFEKVAQAMTLEEILEKVTQAYDWENDAAYSREEALLVSAEREAVIEAIKAHWK